MEHLDCLDRRASPPLRESTLVAFNRAEIAEMVEVHEMDVASGALVRVAVQTTSGSSVLGVSPHDGNPDETARRVWGLLVREGMEAGAAYDVYLAVSDELATPIAQPFTLDVTVSDEIVAFELTIK